MQCFSFSHCYPSSCIAPSPTYLRAIVLFISFSCNDLVFSSPCSPSNKPANPSCSSCVGWSGGEEQKARKRGVVVVSVLCQAGRWRRIKGHLGGVGLKNESRTLSLANQVASGLCMASSLLLVECQTQTCSVSVTAAPRTGGCNKTLSAQ